MIRSNGTPLCPICSSSTRFHCTKTTDGHLGTYYHCTNCDTIFLDPMPSADVMRDYVNQEYSDGVYASHVRARPLKETMFAARSRQIYARQPGGRLLDVGASAGFMVEQAVLGGFDAYGVELSPVAIEYAAPAIRSRMLVGDANSLAEDGVEKYDVVTAFDIIEHTYDPAAFAQSLRALLRPGGLLCVTTPDTRHFLRYVMGSYWPMLEPLQHTVLFSRKSLAALLRQCGFNHIEMRTARKLLTADYLAEQVGGLTPGMERAYRIGSPLVPATLRTRPIWVNIGEIMAFARA